MAARKGGDSFSDTSEKRAGSGKRGWEKEEKKRKNSLHPSRWMIERERGLVAARRTTFMTILTFSLSGK